MFRGCIAAVTVSVALGVIAPMAPAAVEVGNDCVAQGAGTGDVTALQLTRATIDSLPLSVPSAGVVTSWKVRSAVIGSFVEKLKVLRPANGPRQFTTVAESAAGTVVQGANVFATRLPVRAGDRFGVFSGGPSGASLTCSPALNADAIVYLTSDPTIGSTENFSLLENILIPLSAVVEPDADNDGFGDESQDKCPRSAQLQTECPLISLAASGSASATAAVIRARTSAPAPVRVSATVKVPGRMRSGRRGRAKVLRFGAPARTLAPGRLGRFVLSFPAPLKVALKALSRKRSLGLRVTVSATDTVGQPSVATLALRLKGLAGPS